MKRLRITSNRSGSNSEENESLFPVHFSIMKKDCIAMTFFCHFIIARKH